MDCSICIGKNVVHGDPLYSLVIKDDKGKTVNKYYPVIENYQKLIIVFSENWITKFFCRRFA